MAGVKTQKKDGGKRLETVFKQTACSSCQQPIIKLADAYHVQVIDMEAMRRRWEWKHRKCLNLATK